MDKETLSNYGWIVICVLVLSVMIALATPFGKYVGVSVSNTIQAYRNANEQAVNEDKLDMNTNEWNEALGLPVSHNAIIPEGAVYYSEVGGTVLGDYSTATASYKAGDRFPEVQDGDVYVYGDYEYRYNYKVGNTVYQPSDIVGWSVHVCTRDKEQYGVILESINNAFVTDMSDAFTHCKKLKVAPKIPANTIKMYRTFENCIALTKMPYIPETVVDAGRCFIACPIIETIDLSHCINLTQMNYMFASCVSLKTVKTLPPNATNFYGTFCDCIGLEKPPILPSTAQNLHATFSGCVNLKYAPKTPSDVKVFSRCFANCTSLTGEVDIHFAGCEEVFENVDFQRQKITLIDAVKNESGKEIYVVDVAGATGYNYCNECNGYCELGHDLINVK